MPFLLPKVGFSHDNVSFICAVTYSRLGVNDVPEYQINNKAGHNKT